MKKSSDSKKELALTKTAKPVTLATLQVMPATPHQARGLKEMTVSELEAIDTGLRWLPEKLEGMSGVCAVLSGLVLIEIKARCAHKEWTPWLNNNYGKSGRTARVKMQIAAAFNKMATSCHFEPEQLTLALLDDTQSGALDMAHPVVAKVAEWTDGRSYKQLIADETSDGRSTNPGGFRPNALILRAWLEENYPKHPEYLEQAECFSELPEEIQKRFKAEGKRYEERFTKEQYSELETAHAARGWNKSAPRTIFEALDNGYFDRAEDAQLGEWEKALGDALARVKQQLRDRTGKQKGNRH